MNLDLENLGFFIVVEFCERKIGFVKLIHVAMAETDEIRDECHKQFNPYSLGSPLPIPKKLVEGFTQYECKYHEYLEFISEPCKILSNRSSTSNGDLTVNIVERLVKMSIPEFIAWRNLPFFFGFSLH